MKKIFFALSITILFAVQNCTPKKVSDVNFTILQINDVYEIAPLENGKTAGLARVASIKKQLLQENPNTILVIAGDFFSPSLTGTLKDEQGNKIKGKHMIETLNAAGLDYATFGNHEFDIDSASVHLRLNESNFQWTSANTFLNDKGKIQPFATNKNGKIQSIPEYIIREFEQNGQKIKLGMIGVTLPFNKQSFVHYTDVNESARKIYDKIKDSVDLVVAITHLEVEDDKIFAKEIPEIKLLIGGHDHNNMIETVGNTKIAKADANAKTVYIHRFSVNPETKVVKLTSELKKVDESVRIDPKTDEVVQKWAGIATKSMTEMNFNPSEVLTTLETSLDGRESSIRYKQCNLGNLLVESMLSGFPKADFALLNSGSVRVDDELHGQLTQYDILRTLPFGGSIGEAKIKGELLEKILDIGLEKNIGIGGYLQTGDIFKKENGKWMFKGKILDPKKEYSVIISDFLASGHEKNLEFLEKELKGKFKVLPEFKIENTTVKNDLRHLIIAHFKNQKK